MLQSMRRLAVLAIAAAALCLAMPLTALAATSGSYVDEGGTTWNWWSYTADGNDIIISSFVYNTEDVVVPDTIPYKLDEETTIDRKVTMIGNKAWSYCSAAEGFTGTVKSITFNSYMSRTGWNTQFADCKTLESVTLNNGWNLEKKFFVRCSALKDVYLKGDQSGLGFNGVTDPTSSSSPFQQVYDITFHIWQDNAVLDKFVTDANTKVVDEGQTPYTYKVVRYVSDPSDVTVSPIVAQLYTGSEVKPAVEVKDSMGNVLVEGTDYSVSYSDNVASGTGKAIVTMIDHVDATNAAKSYKYSIDPIEAPFTIASYVATLGPISGKLTVGEKITVPVIISSAGSLSAASAHVTFDTTAFKLVDITAGSGLTLGSGVAFRSSNEDGVALFSFEGNTTSAADGLEVALVELECIKAVDGAAIALADDEYAVAGASGDPNDYTLDVSAAATTADVLATYTPMDVTNNGKINIVDAQVTYDLAKAVYGTDFGKFPLPEGWSVGTLKAVADVNADKAIDAADALAIQSFIHS